MSFTVSSLQGDAPVMRTLIRANQAVREFKQLSDYEIIFRPMDLRRGGLVVVTDAALGNVKLNGSSEGTPLEKVYSQSAYFVLVADDDLLSGRPGKFNVLDARSHRIPRVCRSSYAAETLGAEETFDVGLLCRGFIASARDFLVVGKPADRALDKVPLCVVVDAKDVYDKSNSDTSSYGSQKSLAFTVAWMRSVLRRPNTSLRWTATDNMFADAATKTMDLTHLQSTLRRGEWSIQYAPDFVEQVQKTKKLPSAAPSTTRSAADLPGDALPGDDPVLSHLLKLQNSRGWHLRGGVGINVAKCARSYRTPEPRFSTEQFPLRTSFACFSIGDQFFWRVLDRSSKYSSLANQHALFDRMAETLVTVFHAEPLEGLQSAGLMQQRTLDPC